MLFLPNRRAGWRKIFAVHAVFFVGFTLPVTLLNTDSYLNQGDTRAIVMTVIALIPVALLVIDLAVFAFCARGIESFVRAKTWGSLYSAFFLGVSWQRMAKFASAVAAIRKQAEMYPQLKGNPEFDGLVGKGEYLKALTLIERAERAAEAAKRKELRASRRKERISGEQKALVRKGLALGIDRGLLEDALRQSVEEMRSLIARYERRSELLAKARFLDCVALVQADFEQGDDEAATDKLTQAEALILKAGTRGVSIEVRLALSRGDLSSAKYEVTRAERKAKREEVLTSLRARIELASPEYRPALYARLAELAEHSLESREFRIRKYALERETDGAQAASRSG